MAMATQWKWVSAGMAGAFQVGLDYGVLPFVFEVYGVTDKKQVFQDLQIMENEALEIFAKQRDNK